MSAFNNKIVVYQSVDLAPEGDFLSKALVD